MRAARVLKSLRESEKKDIRLLLKAGHAAHSAQVTDGAGRASLLHQSALTPGSWGAGGGSALEAEAPFVIPEWPGLGEGRGVCNKGRE